MKTTIVVSLSLFLAVSPDGVGAFAPVVTNGRNAAAVGVPTVWSDRNDRRPQLHVTYLRFPSLPFLKKRQHTSDASSTTNVVDDESSPVSIPPTTTTSSSSSSNNGSAVVPTEEKMSETDKLMKQVKDAGLAGVISYAAWELGFWTVSLPVVLFGYYEVTGHWPNLSDQEDVAKLGAEAFAFVNFARFAVPLRIGLALSTTPWIQENIVDKFLKKKEDDNVSENTGEMK